MHVRRHDDPSMNPVSIAVEMQKRAFDNFRNSIISQPSLAVPSIKSLLEPHAPFHAIMRLVTRLLVKPLQNRFR